MALNPSNSSNLEQLALKGITVVTPPQTAKLRTAELLVAFYD